MNLLLASKGEKKGYQSQLSLLPFWSQLQILAGFQRFQSQEYASPQSVLPISASSFGASFGESITIRTLTDKFVRGRAFLLEHGKVHRDKFTLVDFYICVAVFLTSFRFRQTNCADLRMSKDNAGDIGVIKSWCRKLGSTEKTICETSSCCDRN